MGQQEALPHVESHWDAATETWSAPVIVESPMLAIHGLCPAINYGQQAFEGMKAFRTEKDEIRIFRVDDHANRFRNSASFVSIPEVPNEHFSKCVYEAVKSNHTAVPAYGDGAFMYIRPLLMGSSPAFIPGPHNNYTFCVFAWPYKPFMGREPLVAHIEREVDHAASRGFGSAKIGGNYAPFVRWTEKARKKGFTTSLFLDSKTQSEIEEFTFSGFLGIKKDGESYTIVGTNCNRVVKSITADSCYQIARSLGWKVEIRPIHVMELASFDEVVSAGTASSVLPVGSITSESTGQKFVYLGEGQKIGPAATILEAQMSGIQQGTLEDVHSWTTPVDIPIRHDLEAKDEALPGHIDAVPAVSVKDEVEVEVVPDLAEKVAAISVSTEVVPSIGEKLSNVSVDVVEIEVV